MPHLSMARVKGAFKSDNRRPPALEGPRELRRREDVGRGLPPLLDGFAAGLMQQRRDRVRWLSIRGGDDDDLALVECLRVTLAHVARDDPAGQQLSEAIPK